MKLTNTIRDAFIRAAMSDVPNVDYSEKTIKVVLDDAVSQLPPKIKALYKDKDLNHFVRCKSGYYGIAYVQVPCCGEFKLGNDAAVKVAELKAAHDAQDARNTALRFKLKAVAYSVSTRKALVTALPEFEKYLPADEAAACRTVPAIANVVSDFVAAGWPKGKSKAPRAAA